MTDDKPDLYHVEQQSEGVWAVIYAPEDAVHCYVPSRDGHPVKDAEERARITADILNATVDMCSGDIRQLLDAYETAHGRQHHADWRDGGDSYE